ncbi:ABC transporter substrate-binding protein [Streptomyces aidingensis]|uniref:Alpha-glucoside transport system substrate-binding protein n=1 Tax=Streptomyces aidingensis TaxID=910347 RepID=A0A1I1QX14_9ACTN|nr:ABC transporter substrate-binding protein [Streptomyces aidingensis]SFD26527.1 alpha-glucoside transport system substrate-binding protein [Streptomyces aidingensis]
MRAAAHRARARAGVRFRIRAVLTGLLLLGLSGTAACAPDFPAEGDQLTVIGPWTGVEEKAFREQVLDVFEEEHGITVHYEGTTAIHELILSSTLAGDPPDIAIQSGLGELADYHRRGLLQELPPGIVDEANQRAAWLSQPSGMPSRYWVPVKADLKSIVWHRGDAPPDRADVSEWCIGMLSDATSGWPGSDWIEDILLQQAGPQVYEDWASRELAWDDEENEAVATAWRTWLDFMHGGDGGAGKYAEEALTTDARDRLLFDDKAACALEHQGSFARTFYPDRWFGLDFTPSAGLLPANPPRGDYHVVSGDFAVMLRESDEAELLLEFLASEEIQRLRAATFEATSEEDGDEAGLLPPSFSADRRVTDELYTRNDDPVGARIVRELDGADALCLDASDVMPPVIRRVFHEAALESLAWPWPPPAETPGPGPEQQDPLPAKLADIQRVQDELPGDTPRFDSVCG